MTRHLVIGVIFVLIALQGRGQVMPERAAIRSMEKKRWQKAEVQLRKSIAKDSVNAIARYYLSGYFFAADNPFFNLDSAYAYSLQSLRDFEKSGIRQREKVKRISLDSGSFVELRERIDSAAFEHARTENTEEAYIRFLEKYTWAAQRDEAVLLRNEIAYLDALKTNTYQAFYDFLEKYPLAARAGEAREKYNKLLFETSTKDRRLQSYEKFLRDHPETPFREEVERNIFELFTLSGEVERYLSFINAYPNSSQQRKAVNILYHLFEEKEDTEWPGIFHSDSLQNILKLQKGYIVPVLHNGKFGFMDNGGLEIIPATIGDLSDDYKCGNITEDVIVLPDRILALDKSVVYRGKVDAVDDMGSGFLKLTTGPCSPVIHKSGFFIETCAEDARLIGGRFIGLKKNGSWSLSAFTGKRILHGPWQDMMLNNGVLALKKNDRWSLVTLSQLPEIIYRDNDPAPEYDDVRFTDNGFIWVKANNEQGILNLSLEEIVKPALHDLTPAFFGFVARSTEGVRFYDTKGKPTSHFENAELHEPWVKVTVKGASFLFDINQGELISRGYDSIRFAGPFVVGRYLDSARVYFTNKIQHDLSQPFKVEFVPGKDTTAFLAISVSETVTLRRTKTTIVNTALYSKDGKKLFSGEYDRIQYAGEGLFIVHKKEKKGLVDMTGKIVIPVEYDAIGSVVNNVISLLKSMRFGLYNISKNKLIKPRYDKNLVPYNDRLIAAYRNGKYTLVDWDEKEKISSTYEEITFWNDSTAMVRKNQKWALLNIHTENSFLSDLEDVKLIRDFPDEKIAIIRQNGAYGVMSSTRGIVIPVTFTDIINIGSRDEPLYFTEKHISEADVFVVIYYDKTGKFLRKEVYQEAEDYEKIYCHN